MREYWIVGISLCVASAASAQQAAPPPTAPDPAAPVTVVVTGKAPPVVHKIDRSVYDLKSILRAQTGTLGDVLSTLPSVNVSPDGTVTVRGSSVQILIDGKPSAALHGANLAATLQSMAANTIDKIEVITNPGAEFRTDAATVINIITKKRHGQAPTGNLMVNTATQANRNSMTLSGSGGIGKWTFNGSLAMNQEMNDWSTGYDREGLDTSGSVTSHSVSDLHSLIAYRTHSLDGGMAYATTEKDSLSLNVHVSTFNNTRRADTSTVLLGQSGNTIGKATTLATGPFAFDDDSLSGTWKHQGGRDGETFTVVARHEENGIIDNQAFSETQTLLAAPAQAYLRRRNERQLTDELSGDYVLPLATDTQFKVGFDFESDQDQAYNFAATLAAAGGAETPDPQLTSRFLSSQVLSAAYVDYQQPLGKWQVEGGLRIENLTTMLGDARGALYSAASDLEWSPSLFLSREFTTHQKIKFTYSRRVDRPAPNQLTAAPIQIDAQNVFIGNPSLRPAKTDSFEAGYDYTTRPVTFSATAYLRQTRDEINSYAYYNDPADTVLVNSPVNIGKSSRTGLDMSLDLHPSPKFAYSLSSNVFTAQQTVPFAGVLLRQSVLSHFTKAIITLTPTAVDQIQISAQLIGRSLLLDGYASPSSGIDLDYTHTLSPRLKFVATARNVANTVHNLTMVRTPQLRNDTRWRPHDDTLYISLTYKLGALPLGPTAPPAQ